MGVGLTVPQLGEHVTRRALRGFCERAEAVGFDSLWVQEHLYFPLEPKAPYAARPGMPVPEAYRRVLAATETLMAAAAWTERVRLGTGILVGGYHRPVELAQRLATIDQLSEGRLVVGLSVGWSKDEHEQMDVEFETRGRRMDELVAALLACWGPDPVEFHGEFFDIDPALVQPKPFQDPRPKLLSGMRSGPGLRRTAAWFDIWNPASGAAADHAAAMAEMATMRPDGAAPLELYLRIFTEPPFTVPGLAPMTVEQLADRVATARSQGYDHVVIDTAFTTQVTGEEDWVEFPERLAEALR
ncbi:MAG: TIGR03619 family F420-dependent LLM class oxidoreductase [Ilumatobacteraceae bacterium]